MKFLHIKNGLAVNLDLVRAIDTIPYGKKFFARAVYLDDKYSVLASFTDELEAKNFVDEFYKSLKENFHD